MTAPSTDYTTLQAQRRALLLQLAPLDQLRRGSLTEQYFTGRRKDGTRVQRGPYPLLTRKQGRKTVSVRVSDPALLPLYRQQLAAQRQFDRIRARDHSARGHVAISDHIRARDRHSRAGARTHERARNRPCACRRPRRTSQGDPAQA